MEAPVGELCKHPWLQIQVSRELRDARLVCTECGEPMGRATLVTTIDGKLFAAVGLPVAPGMVGG